MYCRIHICEFDGLQISIHNTPLKFSIAKQRYALRSETEPCRIRSTATVLRTPPTDGSRFCVLAFALQMPVPSMTEVSHQLKSIYGVLEHKEKRFLGQYVKDYPILKPILKGCAVCVAIPTGCYLLYAALCLAIGIVTFVAVESFVLLSGLLWLSTVVLFILTVGMVICCWAVALSYVYFAAYGLFQKAATHYSPYAFEYSIVP